MKQNTHQIFHISIQGNELALLLAVQPHRFSKSYECYHSWCSPCIYQKDPEGNEAIIRFSRKEKHQYVTSEKNGKATKWIVDYIDGKWVERKK